MGFELTEFTPTAEVVDPRFEPKETTVENAEEPIVEDFGKEEEKQWKWRKYKGNYITFNTRRQLAILL